MSATLDTEKADVLTGLIRRDGGRYSTRRVIPKDLRPAYGGKEVIVKALGTADLAEAKRLHVALWAAQDREFAEARAAMAAAEKAPAVETKAAAKPIDIDAYAARALVALRKKRAEYLAAGRLEDFNLEAREGLETYQAILEGGDAVGLSLPEAEGMRVATLAILTGEGAAALAAAPAVKPTASGGPRVPLADVLDKWKAERTPQPRTVRDLTRTVKRFEAVVGKLAVQDVTKQHVIAFKDTLLSEGKSPGNINVIIPFLGTLFNYAVDNDLIPANPAKGIKVADKRRAKDKRLHFDRDELKAMFSGPVHTDGARPVGGGGEAAYWLPLLALYTGARQTELGQLHPDDVYEEAYLDEDGGEHSAWVMRFAENEERGQKVKTEGSERRIPIHPDLIGLGFLRSRRLRRLNAGSASSIRSTRQRRANLWATGPSGSAVISAKFAASPMTALCSIPSAIASSITPAPVVWIRRSMTPLPGMRLVKLAMITAPSIPFTRWSRAWPAIGCRASPCRPRLLP